MHTIAVGFDGSPDARSAVQWACELALQTGADVTLVHAVGLLEHLERPPVRAEFEAAAHRIAADCGLDVARVHWHVADGDACSVLLRSYGAPVNADLLVVGSRGQGAHAGLLLGSTSLELAQHTRRPLVVVPQEPDAPR